MPTKKEVLANEPSRKGGKERKKWKLLEIIPESGKYSSEVKLEVLLRYATNGSIRATAKEFDIPRKTVQDWTQSEWFPKAWEIIQDLKARKIDARLQGIMEKSLDHLEDAISRGDEVVLRDGQIVSKRISARDLAYVMSTSGIAQRAARKAKETVDVQRDTNALLMDLANKFTQIAKTGRLPVEIDGEIIDAEIEEPEGTLLRGVQEGGIGEESSEAPEGGEGES